MGVELVKKEESNYKKRNKEASEKKTRQKWPLSDLDSEVGEVGDFRFLDSSNLIFVVSFCGDPSRIDVSSTGS